METTAPANQGKDSARPLFLTVDEERSNRNFGGYFSGASKKSSIVKSRTNMRVTAKQSLLSISVYTVFGLHRKQSFCRTRKKGGPVAFTGDFLCVELSVISGKKMQFRN